MADAVDAVLSSDGNAPSVAPAPPAVNASANAVATAADASLPQPIAAVAPLTSNPVVLWKPWRWWRIVPPAERHRTPLPGNTRVERVALWIFAWAPLLVPLGVLILAWLYQPYVLDGPEVCGLRRTTGIPCPTCGMTRSFCFLTHGEWQAAFGFNGLGPPLFAAMCITGFLALLRRLGWLYVEFQVPRGFWTTVVLVFVGVYAVRLYFFFSTPEYQDALQDMAAAAAALPAP